MDGTAPAPPPKKTVNLKDKYVCITGTITGMTRSFAFTKLRKLGARPVTNLTTTTDYLVTGYGVGQSKLKLAARYKIPVIDATEIFKD